MSLFNKAYETYEYHKSLVGMIEAGKSPLLPISHILKNVQIVDRANSELSKLIIGQTMTIEDGSSLSQSETHLEVFQNLVESDCDMLRDIVNNQLIPRMVRHGFPVKGLRFDWDYSIDYTPEQQKAYEEMVLQHYKVKPQYFEEKYGIPCEEKEPKEEPDPTEPKKKKDGKPAETLSRFFD